MAVEYRVFGRIKGDCIKVVESFSKLGLAKAYADDIVKQDESLDSVVVSINEPELPILVMYRLDRNASKLPR